MTIESLIEFVELYRGKENTDETRKNLLIEQRDLLEQEIKERQKTINYLSYKIDNYESHTLKYENEKLAYEQNKGEQ